QKWPNLLHSCFLMRRLRSKAFPRFTVKSASGQQRHRRPRRANDPGPEPPPKRTQIQADGTCRECDEPTFSRNGIGIYGMSIVGHSGLMPANFTTLAHFSMSSAMNLPNSADELANAV